MVYAATRQRKASVPFFEERHACGHTPRNNHSHESVEEFVEVKDPKFIQVWFMLEKFCINGLLMMHHSGSGRKRGGVGANVKRNAAVVALWSES